MAKNITTVTTESDSVMLKLASNGKYTWEIKVYGDKEEDILEKINKINLSLCMQYYIEKDK